MTDSCTLYDVGHDTGTNYLVVEYLEGQTLAERLREGRRSTRRRALRGGNSVSRMRLAMPLTGTGSCIAI